MMFQPYQMQPAQQGLLVNALILDEYYLIGRSCARAP